MVKVHKRKKNTRLRGSRTAGWGFRQKHKGHGNSPKSGCLSMYKFAGLNETQKRTLGLGDKLGMNALYGSTDIINGTCGS